MADSIQYDYSYLDDAIRDVNALKGKLPVKKGSSYTWGYLYTGQSQGDVLNRLTNLQKSTENRSRQIEILLNNVLMVLTNAKNQMKEKDEKIAKEISGK